MALTLYQVDSFTNTPFSGNPAGVCILAEPADKAWMQNVAREMNLSETAFLYPQKDTYHLRWFTPAVEVDLCGHATLASAHILWETGILPPTSPLAFTRAAAYSPAKNEATGLRWIFPPDLPNLFPHRLA